MFKKLIALTLFGLLLSGCAGSNWNIPAGNTAMSIGIKVAAYEAGLYVGKSKTTADDEAIALAYKAAREGTLDPVVVAKMLTDLKINDPRLSGILLIALSEMGATFDTNTGGLISLSGIPVEYWDKAAEGYALGYELGKAGQKAIAASPVKSAVIKYMPKKK
jgi:hypothetical protein